MFVRSWKKKEIITQQTLCNVLLPTPANQNPLKSCSKSYNSFALILKNSPSPDQSLSLYARMHRFSAPFDSFCILFTLKSCSNLNCVALIRHLHAHTFKLGFHDHLYVANALLHAYGRSSLAEARTLFDLIPIKNTVTWNIIMSSSLKQGDFTHALWLFDQIPYKDLTSWSTIIAGFFNQGDWNSGFSYFRVMISEGKLNPDQPMMGSILYGCGRLGSVGLHAGRSIHGVIIRHLWCLNADIGTVIVDMYCKCGYMRYACRIFEEMKLRDVKTWTSLICGSARNGYDEEAISLFEVMRNTCVRPNEVTFTGVLSACARAGMVDRGRCYFAMIKEYALEPNVHHYGCIVEILGKAGLLEEARKMIKEMKMKPNVVIWSSFLYACREHKKFELAEAVEDEVESLLKPAEDGGVYTLLSDISVLSGKRNAAEKLRFFIDHNVKKTPGCSFITSSEF